MIGVLAALIVASSCEKYEDGRPSKNVRSEFSKMYPDAWDVEWERTGSESWQVSFETGKRPAGTERKAWYDLNGNWIQTLTEVFLADVPQNIKNYLHQSEYGSLQFEDNDAEYFETSSGETFYRFDLMMGHREIQVDVYMGGDVIPARYGYF